MKKTQLSQFRGRLLGAAGLSLIAAPAFFACSNEVVVYGGTGGAGGAGGQVSATSGPDGAVSSTDASNTVATSGNSSVGTTSGPTTGSSMSGGGSTNNEIRCFQVPAGGCPAVDVAHNSWTCTEEDFLYIEQFLEGPLPDAEGCCYVVITNGSCGEGRPFTTPSGALVSDATPRDDWSDGPRKIAADATLTERERAALAESWTRSGLFEHASIASFSRFALELMAVGAPADLVADAHRAAIDEIEHAQVSFALASRFADQPVGPGAFPLDTNATFRSDLANLAAATAAEGCIGETLAAALVGAQRDAATDPEVYKTLRTIAEDETRHAELAWRTVAWALKTGGPEVREAVQAVFTDARSHMIEPANTTAVPSHGLLSARDQVKLQMHVLNDVIGPCAQSLLA